jgi:hypothetical protein
LGLHDLYDDIGPLHRAGHGFPRGVPAASCWQKISCRWFGSTGRVLWHGNLGDAFIWLARVVRPEIFAPAW